MTDLEFVKQQIENIAEKTIEISENIWELAELPYEEEQSAKLLCDALREQGFTIETGIAGMPTAFTGTYAVGTGKPVSFDLSDLTDPSDVRAEATRLQGGELLIVSRWSLIEGKWKKERFRFSGREQRSTCKLGTSFARSE
jgi:hypothetical protein